MSIFGSCADMMVPDVLVVLGARCGVLSLRDTGIAPQVDLHIQDRQLTGLTVGARAIQSVADAEQAFMKAIFARKGTFAFTKAEASQVRHDFRLPLEQLVLLSLTTLDEVERLQDILPSPGTVFQRTARRGVPADPLLREFIDRFDGDLRYGVSARQLSGEYGLPLESTLLSLHKLRTMGSIAPIRAAQRAAPTTWYDTDDGSTTARGSAPRPMSFTPALRSFFKRFSGLLSSR